MSRTSVAETREAGLRNVEKSREVSLLGGPEAVCDPAELISPGDHRLLTCLFLVVGTSALFYWNSALNTLYAVVVGRYAKYSHMSDIFTGIYTACACVTACCLSVLGASRPAFHFAGGFILLLMCLFFAWSVSLEGSGGLVTMYIGSAIAAISEMFFQVSGFALAVSLPRNYAGWLSFGYGVCGVITFSVWMLLSQGIFRIGGEREFRYTQGAVWTQFALAAAVICLSLFGMFFVLKKPSMQPALIYAGIKKPKALDDVDHSGAVVRAELGQAGPKSPAGPPDDADDRESISQWLPRVLRASWICQFGLGLLFIIVMFNYPNIAPYQWGLSVERNDILTGMNQTGEFVGRMLGTAAGMYPALVLKRRLLLPLTLLKVIFPVLSILTARAARDKDREHISHHYELLVFLMLTNSFTTGWYATCYMIRVPQGLSRPQDKARASSIAIGVLVACISAGLWLAYPVDINKPKWS